MSRGPRAAIAERKLGEEPGFRWRGHDVSRIEGFSDAVFAFALTLLVVALEVPKTYEELMDTMRGFFAFSACFAVLYKLWWSHYSFFRRYGLADGFVIVWNAVLLFLVMFFIYPLKFLFTQLFNALFVELGLVSGATRERLAEEVTRAFANADGRILMTVYGAGFLCVSLVFALLYRHALQRAEFLGLDAVERHMTVDEIQGHLLDGGVAVFSIGLVLVGGKDWAAPAGWSYMLLGPVRAWHGMRRSKSCPKPG